MHSLVPATAGSMEALPDRDDPDAQAAATDAALEALMGAKDKLRSRRTGLRQAEQKLEGRKAALAEQNSLGQEVSDTDKIKLNVGGEKMMALRATLTQFPSKLATLFSGRWEARLPRDGQRRVFLDVNPYCFRKILDFHIFWRTASDEDAPALPAVNAEMQECFTRTFRFLGLSEIFGEVRIPMARPAS